MSDRQTFRQQIVDALGTEDLAIVCHDLGIDPDRIGGEDKGEEFWADQIITYFERRQRIPDLLAALRRQRPNINWAYQPSESPIALEVPRRLPIPVLAGIGIVLFVLVITATIFSRAPHQAAAPTPTVSASGVPASAPSAPTQTPAPAPTQLPSAVTPATRAPQRMSPLNYNIVVADFGQLDAGGAISSPVGRTLSESFADSLRTELGDASVLSVTVRSDLQPRVWSGRDAEANGWQIGPIATLSDAQRIGDQLGAQIVIYGNFAVSHTIGQLDVGYYIPQATNTADELSGSYSLGSPVPTNWPPSDASMRAIKVTVTERQRLISRVAIGLAYDLLGRQDQALTIFESAIAELKPQCGAGREVLYFLAGREHLLLAQSAEAERAHRVAYACDKKYARALLGLGDVNFQLAAATQPGQRLKSAALKDAYAFYSQAEESALTTGAQGLVTLARLGLGLTKQLEGSTYYTLNSNTEDGVKAKSLFGEAMRLIEPALSEISRRPAGQKRTLALAYSRLAVAYWYSAILTPDNDKLTAAQYYDLAAGNFNNCIALVPPGSEALDRLLSGTIVQSCKDNLDKLQNTRPSP